MPDYSKGKIYQIVSHQTDQVYIGSTTQLLSHRMTSHRQKFKLYSEGKHHFVTSFHILKYDDAKIELIEDCPCDRKEQLLKREGELIREYQCVNRCLAGRTQQEYREANIEEIREKDRTRWELRKDRQNEQRRALRNAQQDSEEKSND